MDTIQVYIEETPPADERRWVISRLVAYNDTQAGEESYRSLTVFARQGTEIVGGLLGHTHWNWLFVSHLWVADSVRGKGIGRRILVTAENEARARGCEHAHLDTYSFQALPFYEHLGYTIFGKLEHYPVGHTRYFLQKRNLSQTKTP